MILGLNNLIFVVVSSFSVFGINYIYSLSQSKIKTNKCNKNCYNKTK